MQPEPAQTRRERLFDRAEAKRVPLRAILTIDAVILGTIVAVMIVMKLRETILLVVVAAFLALILNPPVVLLQRRARMRSGVRRRDRDRCRAWRSSQGSRSCSASLSSRL